MSPFTFSTLSTSVDQKLLIIYFRIVIFVLNIWVKCIEIKIEEASITKLILNWSGIENLHYLIKKSEISLFWFVSTSISKYIGFSMRFSADVMWNLKLLGDPLNSRGDRSCSAPVRPSPLETSQVSCCVLYKTTCNFTLRWSEASHFNPINAR